MPFGVGRRLEPTFWMGSADPLPTLIESRPVIFSGAKDEMGEIRGNMVSSSCILVPGGCIWRRGNDSVKGRDRWKRGLVGLVKQVISD